MEVEVEVEAEVELEAKLEALRVVVQKRLGLPLLAAAATWIRECS